MAVTLSICHISIILIVLFIELIVMIIFITYLNINHEMAKFAAIYFVLYFIQLLVYFACILKLERKQESDIYHY
jgi:hypothetical protein